jgi:predicted aldo/keto reductase-like oxidoreductase
MTMHRREFIKTAAAAALVASLGQRLTFAAKEGDMPYRMLGRTGQKVSLLGIGGAHIGEKRVPEDVGIQIIRTALDSGVNFLDNCWDYNKGVSEIRMGKALRDGYRDKAFLMTKTDGRDAKTAAAQIDESLRRLQTDHVDLIQLHDIHDMTEPEKVFAANGAIQALLDAKKAGKVRFFGFTGHKNPDVHLAMLEAADQNNFVFDTVQMPLNVMDAHFLSFGQKVLPVLVNKDIGVLGMKPIGASDILKSNTVTAVECLNYAMNLPVSVTITGCDKMEILQQGLDAAKNFKPLTLDQVAAILSKTEVAAMDGKFEHYKFATYN